VQLIINLLLFLSGDVELLVVLLALVGQLLHILVQLGGELGELVTLALLLGDTGGQLGDLGLVLLFLRLELGDDVVAGVLLHLLEVVNAFLDGVQVLHEGGLHVAGLDGDRGLLDDGKLGVKLAFSESFLLSRLRGGRGVEGLVGRGHGSVGVLGGLHLLLGLLELLLQGKLWFISLGFGLLGWGWGLRGCPDRSQNTSVQVEAFTLGALGWSLLELLVPAVLRLEHELDISDNIFLSCLLVIKQVL